ncbi:MAG: hypothetical protein ACI9MJ_002258, partial [Alphaproteobacteria bacterium]
MSFLHPRRLSAVIAISALIIGTVAFSLPATAQSLSL